ncbi:hypothetical protein ACG83_09115 [Frankia sp. R43]|uniref:hypothetical protein n=1 Tax=Frankia sp. R43 TaxID=269536 RepID=UPI0006DA716A|nr:hypothetical protein [Frankia sp. R43]KPM55478.1 hypothetical protein ACG83_09115 [Frankia sp. R43]
MADDIVSIDQELSALRTVYETTPLAESVPALAVLHDRAIFLAHRRGDPRQRTELARVTATVGALRADALYNDGQVHTARRVANHSVSVARVSTDGPTFSNASRVLSGIELYEGRPAYAVAHAGEGIDESTPAGIACLVQRARGAALAGVSADRVNALSDRAVTAAYAVPAAFHGQPGDEDPNTVNPVEVTYHAALASAVAGDLFRADGYADLAMPHLPPGFQAVVHAHLATASVSTDLDRSFVEARRAIALANPFRALTVPLASLVKALRPYRHSYPEVMTLGAELENWHRGPVEV